MENDDKKRPESIQLCSNCKCSIKRKDHHLELDEYSNTEHLDSWIFCSSGCALAYLSENKPF